MLIENLRTFIKETCQNAYQTLCGNKQEKPEVFEAELVLHNNNEDVDEGDIEEGDIREDIQEEAGDIIIEVQGDVPWLPDKEKKHFEQDEEECAGIICDSENHGDDQDFNNL